MSLQFEIRSIKGFHITFIILDAYNLTRLVLYKEAFCLEIILFLVTASFSTRVTDLIQSIQV
jgi:hypothetical protein